MFVCARAVSGVCVYCARGGLGEPLSVWGTSHRRTDIVLAEHTSAVTMAGLPRRIVKVGERATGGCHTLVAVVQLVLWLYRRRSVSRRTQVRRLDSLWHGVGVRCAAVCLTAVSRSVRAVRLKQWRALRQLRSLTTLATSWWPSRAQAIRLSKVRATLLSGVGSTRLLVTLSSPHTHAHDRWCHSLEQAASSSWSCSCHRGTQWRRRRFGS